MISIGPTSRIQELPRSEFTLATEALAETPEFTDDLVNLYMQYADGFGPWGKKDGVVSSLEANALNRWVGEELEKDSESQLLINAKSLTDFVEDNFHRITQPSHEDATAADIKRAASHQPNLNGPRLSFQNFTNQSLSNAKLQGADFRETNLYLVDLTGANLRGADFSGSTLHTVDLSGADLTGANLNFGDFRQVWYDDNTVFPDGFDTTQHGFSERNSITDIYGNYTIQTSGIYNTSEAGDISNIRVNAGSNENITLIAGDGGDDISVSAGIARHSSIGAFSHGVVNARINIDAAGGDDVVTHNLARRDTSGHITIDGGDGYDVFRSDFEMYSDATVTKNDDGSYTIRTDNQVIEVKNFEGYIAVDPRTGQGKDVIDI
ncbi:MAG: pentapeptide repeat-containing protein [Granulosicoccus sp.]